MQKRLFGSTGARVSEVGLGCWQLGGGEWGEVSDDLAMGILDAAVESGVTFFDTADVYGGGRSETLIGRYLKENPRDIFVATKLGRMPDLYPDQYMAGRVRAAVDASLARGAVAFIHKTIDPGDLAAVIRQAIAGNVFIAVSNPAPVEAARTDLDLTPRATEILHALVDGHSNKQIAGQFWLSEQTIKYHLTNIYRKLQVSSRTEAVRQAYEHGLIENPVLRVAALS